MSWRPWVRVPLPQLNGNEMKKNVKVNTEVRVVEQEWFTRQGAASYVGTTVSYIKGKNLNGELPYCKDGKLVFIRRRDLDRMLERMRVY